MHGPTLPKCGWQPIFRSLAPKIRRPMGDEHCVRQYHQSVRHARLRFSEGFVEAASDRAPPPLSPPTPRCEHRPRLSLDERLSVGRGGIGEYGDTLHSGQGLFEQLQSLHIQNLTESSNPCDVATRPSEAGDEAILNRITNGYHYDGDCRRSVFSGGCTHGFDPATITSTFARTSSSASCGRRSRSPSAKRSSRANSDPRSNRTR